MISPHLLDIPHTDLKIKPCLYTMNHVQMLIHSGFRIRQLPHTTSVFLLCGATILKLSVLNRHVCSNEPDCHVIHELWKQTCPYPSCHFRSLCHLSPLPMMTVYFFSAYLIKIPNSFRLNTDLCRAPPETQLLDDDSPCTVLFTSASSGNWFLIPALALTYCVIEYK